jgi:hypothetical protein
MWYVHLHEADSTCYTLPLHWDITAETTRILYWKQEGRQAGDYNNTVPKALVSYARDIVPEYIPIHL